ncbi:MAG TPA: glycosyltransferase family 9 protein [Candidatus Acidoferrales bacterium]|nr:glycosyltransferase family 9 protein [Candidatus Acidoferrales bacterium]
MTRALLYCAGGGIGDSLVASVVARALRARYDRVDALTLPGHRSALERVPDLDEVLTDDDGDERALAAALSERAYDASIVTWATARAARVPRMAGIAVRVGQARRLYSREFTKRVVVRSELGDVTSPWVDILLDYARAVGCDTSDRIPRFVPTPQDEAQAASVMLGCEPMASPEAGREYVILHPTNAIASRRGIWPVGGWAALASALADTFACTVVLSGAKDDEAINAAIVRHARDARVVDIAGKLSIGAFGAAAQRARAFVGITTGTMHVAAAVGTPTVGIFPFQSDFPERWGPLGASTAVVRASYPCHAGDTKESCRDYACIERLDVDRIVAAAQSLTGGIRARHDTTVHL